VCLAGPAAGVINDRLNRKSVMIFADWARAGIVLSMLFVRSRGSLWLLFLLLFFESVCWAMFEPGHRAVIPNITKTEETPIANALSAATWSVNFALGAGIGGLAAVWLGRHSVFIIDSLSFVASALLISRMKFSEPHAEHLPPLRARDLFDFSPIVEGARYIPRDPKRLATIFVKGGGGIMGANWVILPVLGETVFAIHRRGLSADQAGTLGMSILLASRGLGAIFGAYLGGNVAGTNIFRIRWIISASFLMGAIGYLALGVAGSIVLASLTLVFAHCGGSAAWTASTTLLQQQTEDRFRGRVFSAEFAFSMLMFSISSFVAGRLADHGIPVRTLAVWTGCAMFIPTVAWIFASRGWRD
ncbi:MAG TPA: MFS transporter, partial [Bryobacteraceae bacterium]|nr:MFS transporter [Bryobacteraceae bacterium]